MNRITKYTSILALGLAILLGAGNAYAAITLENIGVARDGDSVVVTISTSEVAQFNAFMIDKKPERIVIDLDNVTNNIPQIDFGNLPFKSIHAIRTSQFKTEPTMQARVVLNVKRPLSYSTYRNGNDIIVKLPAVADEIAFTPWYAIGEHADTKLADNGAKKDEPKSPVETEVTPGPANTEMAEKTVVEPKNEITKPASPDSAVNKDEPKPPVETEVTPAPANTEMAEKPVVEPKNEITEPASPDSAVKVEKTESKPIEKVETKPQQEPAEQPAPQVDKALAEPQKENEAVSTASTATLPAPAQQELPAPTAAPEETADNNVSESSSDSAFADEPATETANIDIEPNAKRQAIEYDPGNLPDPFTPLIGNGAGKQATGLPSLENMKLVGILQDIELNRALLEDADGNGYMLKPNDKIRGGYLVSVTDNKAIFQVTEYGWTRTVALELEIPEIK